MEFNPLLCLNILLLCNALLTRRWLFFADLLSPNLNNVYKQDIYPKYFFESAIQVESVMEVFELGRKVPSVKQCFLMTHVGIHRDDLFELCCIAEYITTSSTKYMTYKVDLTTT